MEFTFNGKQCKFLPHSCKRYIISKDGLVYNSSGEVIEPSLFRNEWCVELSWLNGPDKYNVGTLVLITFSHIYLPDHLWLEIEPLYYDEQINNNHIENLTYRFRNGLLPHDEYLGFYYIPTYTKYCISKDGEMLTASNGRSKTWSQVPPDLIRNSKGGYFYTRVVNTPGVSGTLLRHRALCMTFKGIIKASDYDKIVNHLDGVPGNDWLSNLEWGSYSVNNQHAHNNNLTGNLHTAVLCKDLKSGTITRYDNTRAMAESLGYLNDKGIRQRLRHDQDSLYEDWLCFKWDDNTSWPTVDMDVVPKSLTLGTLMAARNVFTGEVITFEDFDEGAVKTGIDKQTISIHLRDGSLIPCHGYNFAWYESDIKWPIHDEICLKTFFKYPTNPPDPIIVTNVETKEILVFESRNELADYFKISKSYATQLSLGSKLYKNKFQFKYHLLRENIKVPS